MKLILVSGSGAGAGKTWAARVFGDDVVSLAGAIRGELKQRYPAYDWFNRSQEYKAKTRVPEWQNKTVREVLTEYGQQKCQEDPQHWARLLSSYLRNLCSIVDGTRRYAVDDVRKICELEHFKELFPDLIHIHVSTGNAVIEPIFDADALCARADYVVIWEGKGL